MEKPKLLVIDDDRLTRDLLGRALERDGFFVSPSADGREALQLMEHDRPALIVSDYEMPEFNGAQLCELVRTHADPGIAHLPIILLTAHSGEDHEVECLQAGANDFVSKPVNTAVLKARIETQLRLHALREQLQQQNTELERWRRSRELDLEAAQITQQAILPARTPQVLGWDIAAHYEPVIQVGGDMYDWMRTPDGGWLLWIADATGHGASAALLTSLMKLVFRHAVADQAAAPGELLREVNAEFHAILRGKAFMTAACLSLRPGSGSIRFAGAGHPPLLIHRAYGENQFLRSQGPPIGILPHLQCDEEEAELAPGDLALLYTDGLYSTVSRDGRMTPKEIVELIPGSASSAAEFLTETREKLRTRGGAELPDDLAMVALARTRE